MTDNAFFADTGIQKTNVTEFSVSEISASLKRAVEDRFGHVRVRGEVSGYRGPHSSGHCYFSLKDERARLEAVIWRGVYGRLQHKPEEGLEVIATGKLTTYPGSSKYQIVIENLEPAGAGALMALLEERKKKLEAEGLFAPERKQLLPFMPKRIGVVTSPTGAVIRDILHRIADRFPLHVMVWPVRVQGETTGAEVSHAINGFNAFDETTRPDVIIVARGGGSIEDLWGFNDEAVVRAAAASDIPLISAVGHETDWTLIDHAADVRAPTPTGAAELAVPVKVELEATIASYRARLQSAVSGKLERARSSLVAARRGLASPDDLLAMPRRRLDDASGRLGRGLDLSVRTKRAQFEKTGARLAARSLVVSVGRYRDRLQHLSGQLAYAFRDQIRASANSHERAERRLTQSLERIVRDKQTALEKIAARHSHKALANAVRQGTERLSGVFHRAGIAHRNTLGNAQTRLNALEKRLPPALTDALGEARRSFHHADRLLENMSYKSALKRGYAVVRDENDRLVGRASEISRGETLQVEFADGRVLAIAGEKPATENPESAKSPQKAPTRKDEKPLDTDNQGSLF